MAAKYPADPRNARAAESLAKLATHANELTDEDWTQLQPHSGWASERFRESISTAARSAGFQNKIKDLPTFVACLVDILSQKEIAA